MRLTALAEDSEESFDPTLVDAVAEYESRDAHRVAAWIAKFGPAASPPPRVQNASAPDAADKVALVAEY